MVGVGICSLVAECRWLNWKISNMFMVGVGIAHWWESADG
jgi:hypothetical protein